MQAKVNDLGIMIQIVYKIRSVSKFYAMGADIFGRYEVIRFSMFLCF